MGREGDKILSRHNPLWPSQSSWGIPLLPLPAVCPPSSLHREASPSPFLIAVSFPPLWCSCGCCPSYHSPFNFPGLCATSLSTLFCCSVCLSANSTVKKTAATVNSVLGIVWEKHFNSNEKQRKAMMGSFKKKVLIAYLMAWKENFWCKFNLLNYPRISLCGIQNLKSLEGKVWVRREHRAQSPSVHRWGAHGESEHRIFSLEQTCFLLLSLECFRAGWQL